MLYCSACCCFCCWRLCWRWNKVCWLLVNVVVAAAAAAAAVDAALLLNATGREIIDVTGPEAITQAALAALDRPTTGPVAGRTALCLAGAYTSDVGSGTDFSLSPGDLDEAVNLLRRGDDAARGTDGAVADTTAFARIADFRLGVDGGAGRCLALR